MKPEDLRIGNLFFEIDRSNKTQPISDIIYKITTMHLQGVTAIMVNEIPTQINNSRIIPYKDMTPIKFTDIISQRIGLKDIEVTNAPNESDNQPAFRVNIKFGRVVSIFDYFKEVEYIHEIQNHYYSCYGKDMGFFGRWAQLNPNQQPTG